MWGRGKKGVGRELTQKAFSEEADLTWLKAPSTEAALSFMVQMNGVWFHLGTICNSDVLPGRLDWTW